MKRPNDDNGTGTGNVTREKRQKNGDLPTVGSGMKLQSDIQYYCMFCDCNTDHYYEECPKSSIMMGKGCSICCEPCEIKEHESNSVLLLKSCVHCGNIGHWSKDCPDPFDDCDFDDVEEDWYPKP